MNIRIRRISRDFLTTLAVACSLVLGFSSASAQNLFWSANGTSQGGPGTWDTSNQRWGTVAIGPYTSIWNNVTNANDTAVFGSTAGAVALGTPITAGGLTFNTTGYSITGSTLTLAGTPVISAAVPTSTISSDIAGTNGLEKTGGGTLVLSGTNNTYSGTTTVSAGTLQGNLSNPSGPSPFGTSTIQLNAGTLTSLTVSANDSVQTFTFGNDVIVGGSATISFGRVGGVGSSKTHAYGNLSIGSSTLSLTAAAISHTLSFTGANLTGDAVFDGLLNTANTNIGAIAENGGPRNLTKTGGNTLRLTGDNTYSGTTTISGGTLVVQGSIASSSGITNNATLTFDSASAQSYSNGISGTGALTKTGAGVLTLGGTNIYTGTTTATSGALVATTTAALPGYDAAAKVIFNGGTIGAQIGGSGWTTTDADTLLTNATKTSGAFGIDTTNGSLTQWTAFTTTNFGTTLGLNKLGSNTLTLDLANSYNGTTTVTAGVLNIQNGPALGSTTNGTTVLSGAALEIQGGITTLAEALTLNGSGISNGGALRNISGNNTYAGNITLGSSARINSDANLLTGSGTVTLGANTLTVGGAGNTTLSNNVTGTNGNLTKVDAGTLILTNNSNTYTGTTTVNGGILEVGSGGRLNNGSYGGAISIASGAALNFTTNQAQTLSGAITGSGNLTKTNAGALTLNGNNVHTASISSATGITLPTGTTTFNGNLSVTGGNLTMVNGTTVSGSGLLTMSNGTQFRIGQNNTVNIGMNMKFEAGTIRAGRTTGGTGNYNFNGDLELGGNVFFGATSTSEVINAVFNGNISDGTNSYSLTFYQGQNGTVFTLAGDNTFDGGVIMNLPRTLNLNSATALGTGTFTIGSTATLDNTSSGGAVVMTANNAQNWNSNFTFTGTNSLDMGTGAVTINANRSVTVNANTLAVGGIGQDAVGRTVTKLGAGTLAIQGASTYTGSTTITTGTLQLGNGGTAGSLTGTSGITNNASLTINRSNAFTQTTDLNNRAITGTGSFSQAGSGTTTLSLVNTYNGTTNVNAGTLLVSGSGSINTTSAINVAAGARFANNSSVALTVAPTLSGNGTGSRAVYGGTGTLNAALTLDNVGDVLSPGNSPGIQTFGVDQSWASNSYDWELNDWALSATAGTNFDQIAITGNLTLTGSGAGSYVLNVLSLNGTNETGTVQNFTNTDNSWAILTATGNITGFDPSFWTINTTGSGNFTAQNPSVNGSWNVSLVGGNTIQLNFVAVPEPATIALLASGIAIGGYRLARRRRG